MQKQPILSFHNLDPDPAIEALVTRRIAALESHHPRLIGCELRLDAPQKRKRHGRVLRARLTLELPGPDVTIEQDSALGSARDDLTLAVNRAFKSAEIRLKKQKKVMGGLEVKHHPPQLHGKITRIEPELGYGYVRADDGREVYFQREGLSDDDWAALAPGTRLRFRERDGEKGPYATGVSLAD